MLVLCLSLACLSGASASAAAAAEVPRPGKLGLCVACHGEDGRGQQPGQPHLAGQDEAYLRSALHRYRDGQRSDSVMNAIAGTLAPADIEALSRWYASRGCACADGSAP
jgi:cytochrome c553